MKKSILLIAAAMLLSMTACQKEDISPINNTTNTFQDDNVLVKSTADLIGTDWTFTLNLLDSMFVSDSCGWDSIMGSSFQLNFGLNFDSTYAHLSFPDEVVVMSMVETDGQYSMEEIESMNFAYAYDPTTQTGSLTANTFDDNGNPDTMQIPFNYDTTTDAILIDLHIAYGFDESDTVTYQLVFHRNI